jgi:hypothetical protein
MSSTWIVTDRAGGGTWTVHPGSGSLQQLRPAFPDAPADVADALALVCAALDAGRHPDPDLLAFLALSVDVA